jgi:hypothetical protein
LKASPERGGVQRESDERLFVLAIPLVRVWTARSIARIHLMPKNLDNPLPPAMAHLDLLLDEAVKDTFPASDPVAINVEPEPEGYDQSLEPRVSRTKRGVESRGGGAE